METTSRRLNSATPTVRTAATTCTSRRGILVRSWTVATYPQATAAARYTNHSATVTLTALTVHRNLSPGARLVAWRSGRTLVFDQRTCARSTADG